MESLFITGATGFIGSSLISQLGPARYKNIYCLSRKHKGGEIERHPSVRMIKGSPGEPESYASALAGCRTVVHLAAMAGRGAPDQFFEANAQGTKRLIEQCELNGVENFLHVSTITVKFPYKNRHYYAQSKALGEEAVQRSRLRYLIVRPTTVIGPGGGGWRSLSNLARCSFLALPGNGKTRVQPITLEDLGACLRTVLEENLFTNETVELGGPEALTLDQLLKRIHARYHKKELMVFHIPVKPVIAMLLVMEKIFSSSLPITVGELSAYWQDSAAEPVGAPGPARLRLAGLRMMNLDQMIERRMSLDQMTERIGHSRGGK